MTTTETTQAADDMTAEDHIRKSCRYAAAAENRSSGRERSVDLQAAQVHATLAQALQAAELMPIWAALVEAIAPAQPASGGEEEASDGQ